MVKINEVKENKQQFFEGIEKEHVTKDDILGQDIEIQAFVPMETEQSQCSLILFVREGRKYSCFIPKAGTEILKENYRNLFTEECNDLYKEYIFIDPTESARDRKGLECRLVKKQTKAGYMAYLFE